MNEAQTGGPERRPPASIEAVDRKLNVFALANGMDLERRGDSRVLVWYREGMERCVRVEPQAEETWAIRAVAVPDVRAGGAESIRTLESALRVEEILGRFRELFAGAMDAANAIAEGEAEGRT